MVVQRTINSLRDRPKDERVAVAGGIAIAVVTVLLVGWVVFFLHGIGSGTSSQATNPAPSAPTQSPTQTIPTNSSGTVGTSGLPTVSDTVGQSTTAENQ